MTHFIKDPVIGFTKGVLYLNLDKQNVEDHLKLYHDSSAIQGQEGRTKRDGENYHVTIIDPNEMKLLKSNAGGGLSEKQILDTIEKSAIKKTLDLRMIGLGRASSGSSSCTFIVIMSNALQKLRREFDLSPKDFHVTIGFIESDVHGVHKDLSTIYSHNVDNLKHNLEEIVKKDLYDQEIDKKQKDQVCTFQENNKFLSWVLNNEFLRMEKILIDVCYRFIDKLKFNTDLHKRVSIILRNAGYLVGVYFVSKYSNTSLNVSEVYDAFVEEVMRNNLIIRDGLDQDTIENTVKVLNFPLVQNVKWLYELNCIRTRVYRYYEYQYDKKIFTFIESPRNFSFVTNNLAGSSIPEKHEHIDLFNKVKIDSIITLMEVPLDSDIQKTIKKHGMRYKHFYVDDREPMSTEQMDDIIKIIKFSKRTLIHCRGGVGRTATALVGYLITLGHDREMSVRALDKRKTILSSTQEAFLREWKNKQMMIQSTQTDLSQIDVPQDDASQKSTQGSDDVKIQKKTAKIKMPSIMMMVGLPASGKSTFSKTIHDQIVNTERISQDEIRTKGACEELFSKFTKSRNSTVLLDRCNPNKEERKYWLSLNTGSDRNIWCVFFDSNVEECRWRIKNRTDHPTVKQHQGERIVENVAGLLEEPTLDEGFSHIERVCSFKEANQLLLKIGCDISSLIEVNHDQIIKFPRTKHMFNLGAASRDDLILSQDDIKLFLNTMLYIEEKIDGANMGFSIKNFKIIAQNRSHYVNSGYHPQFKLLDDWIQNHTRDLFEILGDETKILYGEWVYAKHSIPYNNLPDYFVAYDLYDVIEQRFYARERLEKLLEGTTVKLIPCVKTGTFKTVQEIVDLVKSKSAFYDGPIEGVYIRRCNENWLEDRAKIVRNDFICGDIHWSKYKLTVNKLKQ